MPTRVSVTGASGFIGSHLVDALEERGDEVRAVVRRTSRLENLDGCRRNLVYATLADVEALAAAMDGADIVYHLAGLTAAYRRIDFDRANATGVANVIAAARRARRSPRRVVYVSSLMAAGPSHPAVARREHHSITPSGTMYGDSKLAGERIAWEASRSGSPEVVIVRPPLVYGPRDEDVLQMIRSANAHLVVQPGLRATWLSAVECGDLVRGIILAGERGRALPSAADDHVLAGGGAPVDDVPSEPCPAPGTGIYYFTDGGRHTVASFGRAAAAALGKRAVTVPVPAPAVLVLGLLNQTVCRVRGVVPALTLDKARGSLTSGWWCDDSRARAELGYAPSVALAAGLERTVSWLRDNGRLR